MTNWIGEGGFFWLRDGLPQQLPGARIISCSINSCNNHTIDSVSETLLWDLIDDRSASNRMDIPMIIIAHSLGGSIAKALFIGSSPSRSSRPEAHKIHSSIKGYLFLGTLQRGQISENLKRIYRTASQVSSDIPRLDQTFDQVPPINEEFELLGGTQVPTICFFETWKSYLVIDVSLL